MDLFNVTSMEINLHSFEKAYGFSLELPIGWSLISKDQKMIKECRMDFIGSFPETMSCYVKKKKKIDFDTPNNGLANSSIVKYPLQSIHAK
jgi:hypothetical protein